MNRKFVTICLSCLAAVALPAAVLLGLGLWTHIPELWSLTLQTVPLSLMFAGLVNFVWFCGPPKPSSRTEAFGRWFLVFVMSAGVGLECTAFFPLLASWINNTQLTLDQDILIWQNTVWGFLSGLAAGLVLQYRESTMKIVAGGLQKK